ncbi:MAG: hypothetical protein Kow00109_30650 [Acidobacteriota bacterium]
MRYWWKRYCSSVRRRRSYFLLCVAVPGVYLMVAAMVPNFFRITARAPLGPETPLTVTPGGVRTIPLHQWVAERGWLDEGFYWNLEERIPRRIQESASTSPLWRVLREQVEVTVREPDGLEIRYTGPDRELGYWLVQLVAERIVARAREGRLLATEAPGGEVPTLSEPLGLPAAPEVESERRLAPRVAAAVRLVPWTLAAVLVVLGLLEIFDPTLKTEREAARYLGLPVLGSLPDLGKVCERLERR